MSRLVTSGDQNTGASANIVHTCTLLHFLLCLLPMNIQGWIPLELTGLISLLSKGLSRVFSSTTVLKHRFFGAQVSVWSHSHIRTWLLVKTKALTIWTFVGKGMSLLLNMLSRFVIAFLPRSKCLLSSWLQAQSTVILELKKIKSAVTTFSPSICHDLNFLNVEFYASFFTPLSSSSRGSLILLCFLSLEWYHLHIWGCLFLPAILILACHSFSPAFCMMYSA